MTRGIILALLAAFSWGSAIVMSKISLSELGASSLFFLQISAATVLSWIILIATRKKSLLTEQVCWLILQVCLSLFLHIH